MRFTHPHTPRFSIPAKTVMSLSVSLAGESPMAIQANEKLRANEIGIPRSIAETFTVRIKITRKNRERLRQTYVLADSYPCAVAIHKLGRDPVGLLGLNKVQRGQQWLPIGAHIERQLIDGDLVLVNRHPSLEKAVALEKLPVKIKH
jgi:DNA-directed RNA polymerase beta' subunit